MDFQRFSTVEPQFLGDQIGYGITVPTNALHPDEAALFIAFLLGDEGRAIMEDNFHPLLQDVTADSYANLPVELQELTVPGD